MEKYNFINKNKQKPKMNFLTITIYKDTGYGNERKKNEKQKNENLKNENMKA